MASSTRSRRAASRRSQRRPAPRAKRPRSTRRSRPRPALISRAQAIDLAGLVCASLALFTMLVLWFGWDGAFIGGWASDELRLAFGGGAKLVPLLAAASAGLILAPRLRPRLRPVTTGAMLCTLSLELWLSTSTTNPSDARYHAGVFGAYLHRGVDAAAGAPGLLVGAWFLAIAGLLLVTGASLSSVAGRIRHEAVQTSRALRELAALRPPRTPAATSAAPAAARAAEPFDAATAFPDLWEPDAVPAPPLATVPDPLTEVTDEQTLDTGSGEFTIPGEPAGHGHYRLPDPDLLVRSTPVSRSEQAEQRVAGQLMEALGHHGVAARLVGTVAGPRVTRYEIQLAPGIKVGKVEALHKDLAYALATTEIRILAPIPGKHAVGVEVPNQTPNIVTLGDVHQPLPPGASPLSVWLGKDISGGAVHCDLAKMPHLLIAGTTGSGKSGCLNAMLVSILLYATPEQVRMILIDPKKVELNHYEAIPHLLTPVVTSPKQAAAALLNTVSEMERRYELLGAARVRSLTEYNRARREAGRDTLPCILVVIDELADLMMVAPAEVEDAIIRLAQKSRAVGIHLVLATQRPSVDVITGMIKANVPSRIAFAVSSQTDSRVILDQGGAEALLGQGDMLYRPLGTNRLRRVQGAYVCEEEITLVVEQCRDQGEPQFAPDLLDLPDIVIGADRRSDDEFDPDSDPLLDDAIRLVVNHDTASVSLIQRRLRVGYTRAGRLIDMLERRGVISGYEGSKPRQVLINEGDLPRLLGPGG